MLCMVRVNFDNFHVSACVALNVRDEMAAFLYAIRCFLVDPVAVLEHANQLQKKAHKVQDLEVENRQLKGRLEEYNSEFAEVKNQG